ncbi:hypothetical protein DSECCO2_551570 [anaerobic digester metagenome]
MLPVPVSAVTRAPSSKRESLQSRLTEPTSDIRFKFPLLAPSSRCMCRPPTSVWTAAPVKEAFSGTVMTASPTSTSISMKVGSERSMITMMSEPS